MDVNSKHGPTQAALAAQARARADAEKRTRQVEVDSRTRMENARKQAEEVEREMDSRMEHARDSTESAVELEETKREKLVGTLRNETYKDVADIKRRTAAELARVRTESERELESLKETYEDQLQLTSHEGQKKMREGMSRNARLEAYQERASQAQIELLKRAHQEEVAAIEKAQAQARAEIEQQGEAELSRIRAQSESGREGSQKHFESAYANTLKNNSNAMARATTEAKRQLDQLRADHALKLSRYEDRLEDPFYRMVDLDLSVRDRGDYYTVEARVPEHEREHLKVTLRGNSVVVSGARRNEEKLSLDEGGSRQVSSFQTYQETLPLDWPVEPKGMLQEFDGDRLIVTLPKKGAYTDPVSGEKRPLESQPFVAARAPRPDFPADIPGVAPQRPDKPLGRS